MAPELKLREMVLLADGSRLFLLYSGRLAVRDIDSGAERVIAADLAGDEVNLTVSLDGRRVSVCSQGFLKIWDTLDGSLIRVWAAADRDGGSRMMPDGRLILHRPHPLGKALHLFDVDTGEERMTLTGLTRAETISVSADGRFVTASTLDWGADEPETTWDLTPGKKAATPDACAGIAVWSEPHCGRRTSVTAFMPGNRGVAGGFEDGLVGISEPAGGIRWLAALSGRITAIAVFPDGRAIVTGSSDGTVHAIRVDREAGVAATFRLNASVAKLVVRPDGKTVVAVEQDGRAHVLRDLLEAPAKPVARETASVPAEWTLAADGRHIFLLYPGRLVVRDVAAGTERTLASGLWGDERGLVSSSDGRRVSLRCRNVLKIWDVESGRLFPVWPAVLPKQARLTPDGRGIADGLRETPGGLGLFDVDSGKLNVSLRGETPVERIQISADNRWVAADIVRSVATRAFAVWDATTGEPVAFADTPSGEIWPYKSYITGAFERFAGPGPPAGEIRGRWLVAVMTGGSVWDLSTGARVFHREQYIRPFTAAAVTPDGCGMIVGFADGRLGVWDLGGKSNVQFLPGHSASIVAIATAPGGRALVSASVDGVVRVCSIENGGGARPSRRPAIIAEYRVGQPLRECVLRPDGSAIVAVEQTGKAHIFPGPASAQPALATDRA